MSKNKSSNNTNSTYLSCVKEKIKSKSPLSFFLAFISFVIVVVYFVMLMTNRLDYSFLKKDNESSTQTTSQTERVTTTEYVSKEYGLGDGHTETRSDIPSTTGDRSLTSPFSSKTETTPYNYSSAVSNSNTTTSGPAQRINTSSIIASDNSANNPDFSATAKVPTTTTTTQSKYMLPFWFYFGKQ